MARHALRGDRQQPAHRRHVALGLGVLPLALSVMTSPAYATSVAQMRAVPSSLPCTPGTPTIAGGPAVNYCGPATATLTIGGKTYSFKNGYCSSIKLSNVIVDVTLGTLVEGKDGLGVTGNAGKPYFELDFAHGQLSQLLGHVYSGGKKLTVGAKIIATGTITSSGSSKGTFKTAKGGTDLLGKPLSVSGSWNCHGVFVKS